MLFFALSGLINALSSSFVGLLVYWKNKKETLNKVFALKSVQNVLAHLLFYVN